MQTARNVRWRRVALFYGIALGWVSLVAVALYMLGARDFGPGVAQLAQLSIAFLYMPAPLVAALIVERLDGEGYLIAHTFDGFRRKLLRLVLTCVLVALGTYATMVGLTWLLGNVLGVPGVGTLSLTTEAIAENLAAIAPANVTPEQLEQGAASLPDPRLLLVGLPFAGIMAGFTINALFGFGEEYGWRGWLQDELRALGPVKANLLTGTMWGLWHAPLIFLGFNFAPYNLLGPFFMVILCIPFSFLLWRARDFTGSLLAPAIIHGMFNGFAGWTVIFVADRNPLVGASPGVVGAASVGIVAAVLWGVSIGRLRYTVEPGAELPEAVPEMLANAYNAATEGPHFGSSQ